MLTYVPESDFVGADGRGGAGGGCVVAEEFSVGEGKRVGFPCLDAVAGRGGFKVEG